ncbi:MAG TPA: hypothetical protein VNX86_03925 [Rhizomicrobium sp.]|jgi:hypothetical protein|nr:hypothetical protein [Rhizomicrobium sp.]
MPLKDLVAKKSEIAESVIEGIVSKYVRYYTDTSEIGFTPDGAALSSENRVLVYLVALMGWRYVLDKVPEVSTKPADLETVLGIPGGTLRPLLKNLKDAHLIAPSDEGYSVREGNLEAIAATIAGEKKSARKKVAAPFAAKVKKKGDGGAARRSNGNQISSNIDAWIKDGFFKSPRTLHGVHHRLHEHGIIARQTSVSGPLLKAVKHRRLKRQKITEGGKEVWAYCVAGA